MFQDILLNKATYLKRYLSTKPNIVLKRIAKECLDKPLITQPVDLIFGVTWQKNIFVPIIVDMD